MRRDFLYWYTRALFVAVPVLMVAAAIGFGFLLWKFGQDPHGAAQGFGEFIGSFVEGMKQ